MANDKTQTPTDKQKQQKPTSQGGTQGSFSKMDEWANQHEQEK